MTQHDKYMLRCIELARLGAGHVAPNPMVGSVLVHNDRIIGEGYHQLYGQAHAEVNCINSVAREDVHLINGSTLYVSLEPCAHYGKTPPCADLIIRNNIPVVVVGCRDPFNEVNGKGIEKLEKAGIQVITGVKEKACLDLNKRFFTFHTQHRPYIVLKWAQSMNGKIASESAERLLISNDYSNRKVHKWRSEEAAILVGTNTALLDNPSLNNRFWNDVQPIRMVIDMDLRLPESLNIYNKKQHTIIFNLHMHSLEVNSKANSLQNDEVAYYRVSNDSSLVHQIVTACYQLNIQSILVEGGAKLLQSFIDEGYWDETRIITNEHLFVETGLPAPAVTGHHVFTEQVFNDRIDYFRK
ncbi:bifunctional diaminohydroxyphosphoribosylaminopyrimidine deaminase/5-amino-6-(5-phosphoribosylamino)uracil reductase RibD [Danxiaibacter flavus]|uniref:Riboflavin biosynthesis protein RibD n=2 Tax=Danxiaibacter flavus TaxID=3049108 RepID=A0ABV3Z8X2_9BACT|nr:bifunctional diaminohydroxyphosphoribosylaminopyrimidine deaminase/5-amino-6-(5-phosphoribosylamino)uracil reductase RibD [Chitinophagaceae bacterium DXS]